eukprot:gene84-683_t
MVKAKSDFNNGAPSEPQGSSRRIILIALLVAVGTYYFIYRRDANSKIDGDDDDDDNRLDWLSDEDYHLKGSDQRAGRNDYSMSSARDDRDEIQSPSLHKSIVELHEATESKDEHQIRRVTTKVVNLINKMDHAINDQDNDGNTPLHLAVQYNLQGLVQTLVSKDVVSMGIFRKNQQGWPALHIAVNKSDEDVDLIIIRLLAEHNVDPKDADKQTPLQRVLSKEQVNLDVVRTLMSLGADASYSHPNSSNQNTPMMMAEQNHANNKSLLKILGNDN